MHTIIRDMIKDIIDDLIYIILEYYRPQLKMEPFQFCPSASALTVQYRIANPIYDTSCIIRNDNKTGDWAGCLSTLSVREPPTTSVKTSSKFV